MSNDYTAAPMKKVDWQIFIGFVLGQITCSYTLGIAGPALTKAQSYIHISSFWLGLLGAGTLIGLFGSVFVGQLSDKIGRRNLFLYDMVALVLIACLQLFTSNLFWILILRIFLGLCIAVDYTVASSLLMEWLPTMKRSHFQSMLLFFWVIGYVLAYLVGTFLNGFGPMTWRIILASSAVIGLFPVVFRLITRVPESPSWLANQGRLTEAKELVHRYIGDEWTINADDGAAPQKKVSIKVLFGKKLWKHTVVGGLFYGCQTFPFFGISIFLPILVKSMGITNPYISEVLYYVFMIVGVLIGIYIFTRIPRRSFLIWTFYISAALLLVLTLWTSAPTMVVLILFSAFSIVLSSSLVLENPYPPELFETAVRGSGVGMCIAISRIGAAAGTFLLPIINSGAGISATFMTCTVVLILGGIVCQLWAPETSPKFQSKNSKTSAALKGDGSAY